MKTTQKLDRENVEDILALTPVQEGMLFHYLNQPSSELYFEQLSFTLKGKINIDTFKKAWGFVTEANEMLRTVFRWEKLEKPLQIVLKKHNIPIKEIDLSNDHEPELVDIETVREKDREEKIDISSAPCRIILCKINDSRYEMILSSYHIIFDGWSNGIILKEFIEAYRAMTKGAVPEKPVKAKYKEFTKWMASKDRSTEREYWKKYLGDFTLRTKLPLDRKSDKFCTKTQNYISSVPDELSYKIKELSGTRNITTASILYCAWGLLLEKYNDSRDVVFGTTVSGRTPDIRGIQNIVGLFINTPPLRIKTSESEKLTDLLCRVDEMLKERVEFELTSLTEIKSQSGIDGKEELFDSIVVIENYPLDQALKDNSSGIEITPNSIFEMTNYDLTLVISTFDNIGIRFIYDGDKFDANTIGKLTDQFVNIIECITNNPEIDVDDVEILSEEEKRQILFDFNNSENQYDIDKTIVGFFEDQAARTPDNIAVRFKDKCLTYKELNEKSNQLARFLKKKGVFSEKVVAIMLNRSLEMAVALMAVLKSGGAYLPIDTNLPPDRIRYMLDDSGAVALLTDSIVAGNLQLTALQNFESNNIGITVTSPRGHIKEFESLPVPDRSLIDINKYKGKIGMASVNNCISLQTTRGCPYECLYCHKVWSKFHVRRSAQSIFNEIEYYHKNGVTNFAVIDDCFNLDMKNSSELFRLILKNKLNIQLFFPNGLRGDILTADYIDLMVEAGTRGVNLSLETASPRLQKLLKKNLDLNKFKNVVDYFAGQHPDIILEMATMHGFPTETEEDAMMTLNFIKDVKWLHFPYVHILKIFPNTEMEEFALEYGVSKQDILDSRDRAFHELPETLPFPKSFTRKYQADFMNEYFLSKERLSKVLPVQMKILDEEALIQKYNAYLPVDITKVEDIIKFAGIDNINLKEDESRVKVDIASIFDEKGEERKAVFGAKKVLFLDLSQYFSSHNMLYKVAEQPIGLIYLLTYLKERFGDRIDGRIYKSGIDFDSFKELKEIVDEYKPDMIGIRTLTYFKEFFHETVMLLRQWGIDVPIITGGPYASSDYDTILKDRNVDLVIRGEGEYTLSELVEKMLKNGFKVPAKEVLKEIRGIAFVDRVELNDVDKSREVLVLDRVIDSVEAEDKSNLALDMRAENLAYVMYTSGSTGKPKGVMVEHRQVNNCILWMQKEFKLKHEDIVVQRTNLSFDPSVWEFFWPLYVGAGVKLITGEQSRDAQYLVNLMKEENGPKMMYCPASLLTGMTYLLNSQNEKQKLKMPWLIIGAEPVSMDTIKSFYSCFEGRIVNTYGPTECTINNTYYHIDREEGRSTVPIGRPVDNNKLYILSKNYKTMPIKAVGEIYISGRSVARGYINNPEKTLDNFLENPFGEGKLYKTGDLGMWLDDGTIEIMGRVDEQVKIRGYRIELGEIESVLKKNKSITDCVVAIKDSKKEDTEIKVCKVCGIDSSYPGVKIYEDSICDICRDYNVYKNYMDKYFGTLEDLDEIIKESRTEDSKYDCLILYSGGKGAAYALYTLVNRGYKVLALTYDNGYFSKSDIENIKMITVRLGVDHIIRKHESTDEILKESINTAKTLCRGCFHTSTSLALEYAAKNGIKLVIGATLSRGQIIENKLFMFYKQGLSNVEEIEKELKNIQKSSAEIDKEIFDHIDIDVIKDKSAYDSVKTVDFYRYCDITNEEMLSFLNKQDSYWKTRKNYAVYSTNCPIKQIGDRYHLKAKGYHYYGSATCWEKRLGHITTDNLKEDINCTVSDKAMDNFLKRAGAEKIIETKDIESKYICAYYVSDSDLNINELKEDLSKELPSYMMPSYFVRLDNIPLNSNGKIDKKLLPVPDKGAGTGLEYTEPTNETEEHLVEIWKKILGVERVSINDNFFDIGGNSILLIQMHSQIEKKYPGRVSMTDLFAHTTIEKLSQLLGCDEEYVYRNIDLKTAVFPAQYFLAGEQSDEGAVFKVELKDIIFDKIKRISEYENIDIYSVFIGMYMYLISEITQNKKITLHAVTSTDFMDQIQINLDELKGFPDLFRVVGSKEAKNRSDDRYSIMDLKNIKFSKSNPDIIPLIYKDALLSEKVRLTEVYDIIVEVGIESMAITCEFDSSRLRKDKIRELFTGYIELIEMLADKYEFQ